MPPWSRRRCPDSNPQVASSARGWCSRRSLQAQTSLQSSRAVPQGQLRDSRRSGKLELVEMLEEVIERGKHSLVFFLQLPGGAIVKRHLEATGALPTNHLHSL